MRTRFLNTDHFASIKTLSFLNLPLVNLHTPGLFNFEEHLSNFGPVVDALPREIDEFPIDAALSKFVNEVVPQLLDVDFGDLDRFCLLNDNLGAIEKENITVDDKHGRRLEIIQFEQPEVDMFLEKPCFSEEASGTEIFSKVQEIENSMELFNLAHEIQYDDKARASVFSVEDAALECMDQETCCPPEDEASDQKLLQFCHYTFPLLEVDETSLRTFTEHSIEDELVSFLENMYSGWTSKDFPVIDQMELLGSLHHDKLDFLSNDALEQCYKSELACVDKFIGVDIISLVDTVHSRDDSTDCFLSTKPVFEEFTFLDEESCQLYEIFFEMQAIDEPGTCPLMFRKDTNFKDFSELIVSPELTLADETFKSMPIPTLRDCDKMMSSYSIAEEMLTRLEPHSISASNGIYLDWHLLEEDNSSIRILSFYQEELTSHYNDLDQEFFGSGELNMGFILCDDAPDAPDAPKAEEYEELPNMPYFSNNLPPVVDSSKTLDDKHLKLGGAGQLPENDAERAPFLSNSMLHFSDLDFFLNPGKATAREKDKSMVEAPGINVTPADPKEEQSPSLISSEAIKNQKLENMERAILLENKHGLRSSKASDVAEAFSMPMPTLPVPSVMKSEQIQCDGASFPRTIIIVNTQNFEKEMIVSRRNTYQKILAMEKEGAQVVERDLNFPVDLIISSAICLVWYDCKNIGKKATDEYEASSCLSLCIENIATNIMTCLSFTFSGCILVFEGEIGFLSTVMESSDGLYAAAASLGIDFQLFCAYSSELTDEIILSSILYATKQQTCLYPRMLESETLAESFLTNFPSVNTLTAHAILSSGVKLIEFLEWSHDRRILAVQRYHIPDESVALFSSVCRYGEREDSKSVVTDCSSSMSSYLDSKKHRLNVDSESRGQKYIYSNQTMDINVDHIRQSEPLNKFPTDKDGYSERFRRDHLWISKDSEMFEEFKWPDQSMTNGFCQNQKQIIGGIVDFSNESMLNDSHNLARPRLLNNEKLLDQKLRKEVTTGNQFENLCEEFIGEIIDLDDCPLSEKTVPPANFSSWLTQTERESTRTRKSRTAGNYPTFPKASEIDLELDLWTTKYESESLLENNDPAEIGEHKDQPPFKQQNKLFCDVISQRSTGTSKGLSFKEQISHDGVTPLSKAIHSTHLQPGSPWTIEFLNRIREKSRLRQNSLPANTPSPSIGFTSSLPKAIKRRSPSILEFFRYKGGNGSRKIQQQKKQKQSTRMSCLSKNERTVAPILPTWTPADKRSRQTLSFATTESGKQTKLVWTDGGAQSPKKRLRSR
ncbi:hypothetical protein K2173_008607 [Erythroxylum novogranatense]|uniref:Protein SHORTAGE IN CHIASMATA 1 n=1 Tax=Erythroxylum novogranatense TaxID=1862640 RepID=A0AAV8SKS2_9ROSI|nr:hypothetical protein K2173_008607 [Erythroxylum novogranatense]